MFFVAPIWLIGLIPWLGITLWMLRGRAESADVPFVRLWPSAFPRQHQRAVRLPPLAVVAVLAALLLCILAAARPAIGSDASSRLAVIVDRGLTMSATSSTGETRFAEASDMLKSAVPSAAHIEWISPPPNSTPAILRRAVQASDAPVVVLLSDQDLGLNDPRLVQFAPDWPVTNVGIESLAIGQGPHPQAMVRVRNQSSLATATLTVQGENQIIPLPPTGESKNYFVDLSNLGPIVQADIDADDNLKMNHSAWCVLRGAWPQIEARSPLPPELERMIEIYSKHRPASENSPHVAVVWGNAAIPIDEASAILTNGDRNLVSLDSLKFAAGPLQIDRIDWRTALADARIGELPPGDWTAVVSVSDSAVIAVQTSPIRRVWIGFESPNFSHTTDFVVFWSAVLDWLGDGKPDYASQSAVPLDRQWIRIEPDGPVSADEMGWIPGVYERNGGELRAVNVGTPTIVQRNFGDWRARLNHLMNASRQPTTQSAWLLIGASGLLLLAVGVWGRGFARAKPIATGLATPVEPSLGRH
jgi:hypothetical protein